jgi:hypothetical protein
MVEGADIGIAAPPVLREPIVRDGYTLTEISIPFPYGPMIGTLLAVPAKVDPNKPVIIAISGHEVAEHGTTPWSNFDPGYWPEQWVKSGYVVFSPSHIWWKELGDFVKKGNLSWPVVWAMTISRLLDAVMPDLPPHNGMIATGLSSGGISASFLMAYRNDIKAGVFAGSFYQLPYLRGNYRIAGVPDDWDVEHVLDYTPIYALLAPRAVEWQMGRKDSFFPTTALMPGNGGAFPGLPRPNSVENFLGSWLLVKRIWKNEGGKGKAQLYIHDGGHIYDFAAAKSFVETGN